MKSAAETKAIVRGYHNAWSDAKDIISAGNFLASDLKFRGSMFSHDCSEEFLKSLSGLLPVMTGVNMIDEFYEDNRAFLLYDLSTDGPAGTMRIAEHFRVENGKIIAIILVFDATEMRKMMSGD
jgi:hypothetical protein